MKTALVIIDLQEGSFTPRSARHDTSGLVERLNAPGRRGAVGGRIGHLCPARWSGRRSASSGPAGMAAAAGARCARRRSVRPQDGVRLVPRHVAGGDAEIARDRALDRHRLRDRLLRRHDGAQRAGARLCDHRAEGRAHDGRPAAPLGAADHRAPQCDLGRFHRAGRAGAGLRVRGRAGRAASRGRARNRSGRDSGRAPAGYPAAARNRRCGRLRSPARPGNRAGW